MAGSNQVVIDINNLTKIYGRSFSLGQIKLGQKTLGVENISLKINKGEIFGFLGPNGAGKTTTIRSILGYLKIQSGSIKINGLDYRTDAITIRKDLSYVPGSMSLYENFTGLELLHLLSNYHSIDIKYFEKLRSIFKVNLNTKIKILSKGNRQQVALIIALASKPDLLILDEPSSGLDPLITNKFHELLLELKNEGKTIFLSSHDLAEVQAICDRVGIIKDGKMLIVEKIEELRSKSLQNMTIEFVDNLPFSIVDNLQKISTVISIEQKNSTTIFLKTKIDINELLKVLSNYKVKKMTLEDANLQEIFLTYYK